MNARLLASRAPFLVALAALVATLLSMSSLARLLPFPVTGATWLVFAGAALLALLPALFARDTPLPAAILVVVPTLAVSSYGASRLDWLRVLKDFGVAEAEPLRWIRLGVAALTLAIVWALHAIDMSIRLQQRAEERGLARSEARAAAARVRARSAGSLALALAGAGGLLAIALVGVEVGERVPTQRGAFVVPLVAAALLVGAAAWIARGERSAP